MERSDRKNNEWRLEEGHWLVHRETRYEINLDACRSVQGILDWIFQVREKSWCSPRTICDLLEHLEEQIGPQGTLCGGGVAAERGRRQRGVR